MFFYLFVQVFSLDSEYCTEIVCDTSISPYCIKVASSKIKISPCSSGFYCPVQPSDLSDEGDFVDRKCEAQAKDSVSCSQLWGAGQSPAGWPCCSNSNCLSNSCSDNTCEGKASGNQCQESGECSAGLYCDSTCKNHVNNGEVCAKDDECQVGSACNSGICVKLFSLGLGETASHEKFCLSYFLNDNKCDALEVKTDEKTEETLLDSGFKCDIGTNCLYYFKYSGKLFKKKPCLCKGVTDSATQGFCPFIEGLANVDWTIRLDYNQSSCSGDLAHSDNPEYLFKCDAVSKFDYYFYTNITSQRKYWNLYKSGAIDSCSKKAGLFYSKNYFESFKNLVVFSAIFMIF